MNTLLPVQLLGKRKLLKIMTTKVRDGIETE
jgi:hypothetical protein